MIDYYYYSGMQLICKNQYISTGSKGNDKTRLTETISYSHVDCINLQWLEEQWNIGVKSLYKY